MNLRTAAIYGQIQPGSVLVSAALLLGFNILLVLSSYITITLPLSPVPITGQTFGVLLVAMALGRIRGLCVIIAYLVEGALGLPVFAGGSASLEAFFGPTGGYLLGFPLAGVVVGSLAEVGWDKSYIKSFAAMTIGTTIIVVCGLIRLSFIVPVDQALALGLYPYMVGAGVKITLGAVVLPSAWKLLLHTSKLLRF
jgi:biotin transport system substrate-specific component